MFTKLHKTKSKNGTMNETTFSVYLAFQGLVGLYNLDKVHCKQNIKMYKYFILITYYNLFSPSRYSSCSINKSLYVVKLFIITYYAKR